MRGAVVAKVVGDKRGAAHDLAAVVVLAVEGTERVDLGTLDAVLAHLVCVVEDEGAHGVAVGGTACGVAHRVDAELERLAREAQALEEGHEHDDDLGVERGVGGAENLGTHLVELAQAPLLRTLATKHRASVPGLHRSAALRHEVVLHGGAHEARGALGAQCQTLARLEAGLGATREKVLEEGARDHAEHLLANDVGGLADAVDEGVQLLEGRRLDHVKAVRAKHLARNVLHALPSAHVSADEVFGSLNLLRHVRLLRADDS